MPEESLRPIEADLRRRHEARTLDVWPEHWHALQVLRWSATQWRVVAGPTGRLLYLGLDYGALGPVLAALRGEPHRQPLPRLMAQLRVMEAAAIPVRNDNPR